MKVAVKCGWCSLAVHKEAGAVKRARDAGLNLYCDHECSGLARRKNRSAAERKRLKAEYDAAYRVERADTIKARKAAHFKATYDPEAARVERRLRAPAHAEYCRRPEYREWKKSYDRQYRCKREFGPFWEAASLLVDLAQEVHSRADDYDIRTQNGTLNKKLNRRRDYDRTQRQ